MLVTDFGLGSHLVAVCGNLIDGMPQLKKWAPFSNTCANCAAENASHCSHSTLSCADMLPTAATALSAAQLAHVFENGADVDHQLNS